MKQLGKDGGTAVKELCGEDGSGEKVKLDTTGEVEKKKRGDGAHGEAEGEVAF